MVTRSSRKSRGRGAAPPGVRGPLAGGARARGRGIAGAAARAGVQISIDSRAGQLSESAPRSSSYKLARSRYTPRLRAHYWRLYM